MPVIGQKSAIMDFQSEICDIFLITNLFCTYQPKFRHIQLLKVKLWPYLCRNHCDFYWKCPFLGKNPPLWISFPKVLPKCNTTQLHGANKGKNWWFSLKVSKKWDKNHEIGTKIAVFGAKIRHYGFFSKFFFKF